MSEIPDALRYGASHSTIRTNRFRLVPTGSDTANPNGTVRVRLPEKSLVRLSSLSAYFNATLTGLVADPNNWQSALMPASYKFLGLLNFMLAARLLQAVCATTMTSFITPLLSAVPTKHGLSHDSMKVTGN